MPTDPSAHNPAVEPELHTYDNPRLQAALAYAQRGWPVFPLHTIRNGECTCGDPECGRSSGKHPYGIHAPHGRNDASTDANEINDWWQTWPGGNIGIATGPVSGLAVLDVDPEHGGDASLAALETEHRSLPKTVQCRTGGGGTHYYFQHPGDPILSRNGKLAPGLDVKADGGSVVAPPSQHLSGKRYEWAEGYSPDEADVAPLPDWLLKLMQAPTGETHGKRHTGGDNASTSDRIPESKRNETLARLAGTMRRPGMTAAEILAALLVVNRERCDPPLPEAEVERIAKSVGRYAPGESLLAADMPLSDLGNGLRLVARHGGDLRYVPQWGKWLAWDGTRWAVDDSCEVMRRAKETMLALAEEVRRLRAGKRRKTLMKFALSSQSEGRLRAMIKLAQSERGIAVHADALDADPWLLNVQNGTVDLRTGQLREHRQADLITKCAPVAYDPEAKAPLWGRFLDTTFEGNAEVMRYVQEAIGYTLTGCTSEQCWFPLYGVGANGKSVFLGVVRALLGSRDYARHIATETLVVTSNHIRIRSDLARLQGARLVSAAETEHGHRLAESLVKQLTGQDPLTARALYQNETEYVPTFKLWLAVNFKPQVRSNDPATWRRIRLIEFKVVIPPEQRDQWLLEKLMGELPGVLNWAIEGCLRWQRDSLRTPAAVLSAVADYRREMDSVGRFIEDECVTGPLCWVASKDLRKAYETWCVEMGEAPLSRKALAADLEERGCKSASTGTQRGWRGIGLRESDSELDDAA
jgi:putative DNA primase/helicase